VIQGRTRDQRYLFLFIRRIPSSVVKSHDRTPYRNHRSPSAFIPGYPPLPSYFHISNSMSQGLVTRALAGKDHNRCLASLQKSGRISYRPSGALNASVKSRGIGSYGKHVGLPLRHQKAPCVLCLVSALSLGDCLPQDFVRGRVRPVRRVPLERMRCRTHTLICATVTSQNHASQRHLIMPHALTC
jgi:hypothetical protein